MERFPLTRAPLKTDHIDIILIDSANLIKIKKTVIPLDTARNIKTYTINQLISIKRMHIMKQYHTIIWV